MKGLTSKPALPGGCTWRRAEFRPAMRELKAGGYVEIAWGGMGESASMQLYGTYEETALSGGGTSRRYDATGIAGSGWTESTTRNLFEVRTDARGRITSFEITYSSYKKGFLGMGGSWKPYRSKVCK